MRSITTRPSREIIVEASEWLIEFRTSELTQQERDRFSAWLRTSPQHIQAYLEVAAAWVEVPTSDPDGRIDVARMIEAAKASPDNIALLNTARRVAETGGLGAPPRRRIAFAAAASVLLIIVGAAAWMTLRGGDTYSTDTGEQRTIRLADGSTVELNAQSRIEVELTAAERRIDLRQGQALFRVAKDPGRPFIVQSDTATIRALGTQFDVYRKTTSTTITVIEGRVAVLPDRGRLGANADTAAQVRTVDPVLLVAGEQLAIRPTVIEKLENPNIDAATAWTQKRLVFEDTPLADVAEEFNRYSTRRLVIADAELARVGISGLYSSTDPATLIAFLKAQPTIHVTETDTEIRIARGRHD